MILSANRKFSYYGSSKLLLLPRINAVGASDTKEFRVFSLNKKAHAGKRRRAVSQAGAVGPIFGGNIPLQKKHPKKWLGTPSHNRNPVKHYIVKRDHLEFSCSMVVPNIDILIILTTIHPSKQLVCM